jgi:hypothetical protein
LQISIRLEGKSSTLGLLVTTKFKVLAALEGELHLVLADGAFETKDNLLGSLGLSSQYDESMHRTNKFTMV